ncbi:chemotaxis protein CheW [Piscinibacter sp.]|jgi:chemotaxis signal transduction protein|uniref:chemotaxis protein CheW n=1 Tax=Piscinibacter sp. TaxID=1903157 RepID=UPI00355A97DC
MNAHASPLAQRAAELRRNFDRSFAEPPHNRQAASLDLLAIRLGGEPHALHLAAVTGLFAGKKLTRLPQAAPEFLGIAGFRGTIVPVYDLRVLLGCAGGEAPRWLVVAATSPVGLAFDGFDGHLRLPLDAIAPQGPGESARPHVRELVRVAGSDSPLRSLIDLGSVVAALQQCVQRDAPTPRQER